MKTIRIFSFLFLSIGLLAACSESSQTLDQKVEALTAEQKYDEALELLDEQPESEEVTALEEEVHLQHGIYLIYNADPASMRENANNALREFIAVLEINPENEKARAEIQQILAIYRSFPDRQPAQDVLDELEEFGFQI